MAELVLNGNFEAWAAGLPVSWEKLGTQTIAEEKADVHGGAKAVKFTTTGPLVGLQQTIAAVAANQTCRVSLWQHVDAAAVLADYRMCIELQITGGGTHSGKYLNFNTGEWEEESEENEKELQLFPRPTSTRYVKLGFEFEYPDEAGGLRVIIKRRDGNPFSFWVDDASVQSVPTPARPTSIDWGELQKGVPNDPDLLDTFISDFSRPDYIGMFREFGTEILTDDDIAVLDPRGITPVIAWEPNEETKEPTPAQIAAGAEDAYIDAIAAKLADYGKPVILRPYWEFNISIQTGEDPTLDPDDFVAMWKHLHARFAAAGATNVKWYWCCLVNFDREEGNKSESVHDFFPFFPGDAYVDYVGADGYSNAFYDEVKKEERWVSLQEVYSYTYRCLMGISGKPFAIGEIGVSERGFGEKADWLYEGFMDTLPRVFPRTEFVMYFNRHNPGEEEWELETSPESARAWRQVVRSSLYSNLPRIPVRQEYPAERIMISVKTPSGLRARWAEDEPATENVFSELRLVDEMNGGEKELLLKLPRDPSRQWPDLEPFSEITAKSSTGEVLWGPGQIDKLSEVDDVEDAIEVAGVGYQAAMQDRKALRFGLINSDMSRWSSGPTTAVKLAVLEAGIILSAATSLGFSSLDPEAAIAAILNDFTAVNTTGERADAGDAYFDSGGIDIGQILYDYNQLSTFEKSAFWQSFMALAKDAPFSEVASGANHERTNAHLTEQSVEAPGPGYRFARLRDKIAAGVLTGQMGDLIAWENLRVLSLLALENLELHGDWPEVGYTGEQILRLAVPLLAPPLEVTDESVEDDEYLIQQAWWDGSNTTVAAIVEEIMKYGLLRWYCKGRVFHRRFRDAGVRRWVATEATNLRGAGADAQRSWEWLSVQWQDVDGSTKTAGPPGSGADFEVDGLALTDPNNPAVKSARLREEVLVLRGVADVAAAVEVAEEVLVELNRLDTSGECTLHGYVMDEFGNLYPVSRVRGWDLIKFPNKRDKSYRTISRRDFGDDEEKSLALAVDAPSEATQAVLERYEADLLTLNLGA